MATKHSAHQKGLEDTGVLYSPLPVLEGKEPQRETGQDTEVWGRERGGLAHPQAPCGSIPPLGQTGHAPGKRSIPTA